MSTYREFRAEAKKKKRRRNFQRCCLILLIAVLLGGLTWFVVQVAGRIGTAASSSAAPASSQAAQSLAADVVGDDGNAGAASSSSPVWQGIGPIQQTINNFQIISPDRRMISLPENGRVDLSYFDDATFVGDSITTGWAVYRAADGLLPNAHVVAEISTSPPVGGVQWVHDRNKPGQYVYDPMQAIADTVPKKVYVMFGTNMLVNQSEATEDKLISDYSAFIDDLGVRVPGCEVYIQSILIPTAAGTASRPGLNPERINRVNDRLAALAFEKGCHYLNVQEYLCRDGVLNWDIAAKDGIHMNQDGYRAWLDYLATHTAYSAAASYVGGTPYPAAPAQQAPAEPAAETPAQTDAPAA